MAAKTRPSLRRRRGDGSVEDGEVEDRWLYSVWQVRHFLLAGTRQQEVTGRMERPALIRARTRLDTGDHLLKQALLPTQG